MDLSKFYLLISKEVHIASDTGRHEIEGSSARPKFEVAEYWLRSMAEEKTRAVVSQFGTGLLIADRLEADLPAVFRSQTEHLFGGTAANPAAGADRSATEGLANAIKSEFAVRVNEYGLEIHRVALQEVKLPPEIYTAAVEACRSAYLPIKAKAEAIERQLKLQAEVDVIGKDATGLKEIAKNIPALAFQEFLSPLFLDFSRKRAGGMVVPPTPPNNLPDAIYLTRDGQQVGPYSKDQIRIGLKEGKISTDDLAWHDGIPNWVPLNVILKTVEG